MKWILLFLAILIPEFTEAGRKIFCYYSASSQARPDKGKFVPEDIDPFICTHIIFAFVDMTEDASGLKPLNWNDLGENGLYARTVALKKINPKLKVLLAVGGWKIGSKPFVRMLRSEESTKTWIENVVAYLRAHGFDGLDMDWEFPATRGSTDSDKYKFTFLMNGLQGAFTEEARQTGKEKLLLTLATASSKFYIKKAYEADKIIKYIDYMLLMTYNYHGAGWEKQVGHHSPLFQHARDFGEQAELHQQWSIDYWLKIGMPRDRLIVGLTTYGQTFKLEDPNQHSIKAPAQGKAAAGEFTQEEGILAFYEVCDKVQKHGWSVKWVDDQAVPYAHGGDQWVGFDSPDSFALKAQNIISKGLGGAFVWSIEMDDFGNICGNGKYPLLNTVKQILKPVFDADEAGKDLSKSQLANKASLSFPSHGAQDNPWKTHKSPKWHSWDDSKHPWEVEHVAAPQKGTNKGRHDTKLPWEVPVGSAKQNGANTDAQDTKHAWVVQVESAKQNKDTQDTKHPWEVQHAPASQKGNGRIRNDASGKQRSPWAKENDHWEIGSAGASNKNGNQWRGTKFEEHENFFLKHSSADSGASSSSGSSIASSEEHHSYYWDQEDSDKSSHTAAAGFDCNKAGLGIFPDYSSCDHFILCGPVAHNELGPLRMNCPAGTKFDKSLKICNHIRDVKC